MKSIFTLAAAVFFSVALYAGNIKTRLTIINLENSTLRIVIDGRKYDGIGKTLSLNELSEGYHTIKVYKVRKGWFNRDPLVYSSRVYFKPNRQVNILIDRSGDVSLAETRFGSSPRNNGRNNRNVEEHDRYGKPRDRKG